MSGLSLKEGQLEVLGVAVRGLVEVLGVKSFHKSSPDGVWVKYVIS